MTGYEYEYYVAAWLRNNDFENVIVTKGSGDFGVDIIAYKNNCKCAVQCKYYSKGVGIKAIQEVISGKMYYNCEIAVVVTNSYFTPNARKLAESADVILLEKIEFEIEAVEPNSTTNNSNYTRNTFLPKESSGETSNRDNKNKLPGCILSSIYFIFVLIVFKAVFKTIKVQDIEIQTLNVLGGLFASAIPLVIYKLIMLFIHRDSRKHHITKEDESEFDNKSDSYKAAIAQRNLTPHRKRDSFTWAVILMLTFVLIVAGILKILSIFKIL